MSRTTQQGRPLWPWERARDSRRGYPSPVAFARMSRAEFEAWAERSGLWAEVRRAIDEERRS